MSKANDQAGAERSHARELLIGGAHLAGLWAISLAQPLLDLLGANPEFFIARGNTAGDILILAAVVTLVGPLVLLGIEALVGLISRRAYRALHLGLVVVLVAIFVVQLEKRLFSDPTALIILLALAAGAAVAYGLTRTRFVRSLLDVLAFAPLVVLIVFLGFSGVSRLVLT
ncbi:MAG TPA: hypothetical protein VFD37_05840, partial [Solirubrobacterales bacterium]|nr:hypothetical protein [Solirubrobacterales bacterium]